MKFFMALLIASTILMAGPARAADTGGRVVRLINATQDDFDNLKAGFQEARRDGGPSMRAVRDRINTAIRRIEARRNAIAMMNTNALKVLPASQRGLFRMVVSELDEVNLSLLALIKDDKGYAGYIRTGDEELIKGIREWQEGIRTSINNTRRCFKIAKAATGPFLAQARLTPLQAH